MELLPLVISAQAYGAYGIGKHEGCVYFVPNAVKGDHVLVRVQERKKNHAFAELVSITQASALRVKSDCIYDESCGGCQWLVLPYETQLALKEECLRDAFTRMAKLDVGSFPMHVHASNPRYYRNRALFRAQIHADHSVHLAFMERGTHEQVPILHCLNIDPALNEFITQISQHRTKSRAQKFRIEVQVLPASLQKEEPYLLLVLHSLEGNSSLKVLSQELSKLAKARHVVFANELQQAPLFVFEEDLGLKFHTAPGSFQQVHLELNHKVRRLIQDFVQKNSVSSVLDLYCGSGNLSLALAKSCSVLGVEDSALSIRIAQQNVEANALPSARYLRSPADRYLRTLVQKGTKFDLVLSDPPRKGMKECVDSLKELAPRFLIYMSCDPMTLARDLKDLCTDYEVREAHLFDFFPNTYHLESLVFLERR